MSKVTLAEIRQKCTPDQLATRDTNAIAAQVSIGRTKIVETRIRWRHVLSALGAVDGQAVIDALNAAIPADGGTPAKKAGRPLATAAEMIHPRSSEGLDVGDPQTRAQLDALGAQGVVMSTAQAAVLKALAVVPDPVSQDDVNAVCWSGGNWIA